MNARLTLAAAGLMTALAVGAGSPAVAQAATTTSTVAQQAAGQRWVTYGVYPTKWQCHALGKVYTIEKKIAKKYQCKRSFGIGPFRSYKLRLLITW